MKQAELRVEEARKRCGCFCSHTTLALYATCSLKSQLRLVSYDVEFNEAAS